MTNKEYVGIAIPKAVAEQIKPLLYPLGYRSMTEFILDATRRHLEKEKIKLEMQEDDRKQNTYMPIEHE